MKSIVFDLDGTLIDSLPDIHAAVNRMLVAEDRPGLALSEVLSFVGNGVPALVKLVMAARDLPEDQFDRIVADTLEQYRIGGAGMTRIYDGVEPALARLQEAGFRMAVCTNKPYAPSVQVLLETGLDRYFDHVTGGDSLAQRKPAPEPLRAAIDALGGGAALFVGDSGVDAATAVAADIPFALHTKGYRKEPVENLPHRYRFDTFDQLFAIAAAWAGEG